MIDQHYRFLSTRRNTQFLFESQGKQGVVLKIIVFAAIKNERWNLGFGDLKDGDVDDSVFTNNHDAAKVIRTVAKTIIVFLETYPERIIVIVPIDEKRKSLYNSIFRRYLKEIEPIFEIIGFMNDKGELYSSDKLYDSFELKFKIR